LAQLLLFLLLKSEMKKVLAVLLIAVVVAYYFGYDLSDFIPSWPASNTPHPKVRRAPAPAEQTQNAAPVPSSGGSSVIANSSDGSLANRWQQYPSPSPKKP
jgi:hypothetical protein